MNLMGSAFFGLWTVTYGIRNYEIRLRKKHAREIKEASTWDEENVDKQRERNGDRELRCFLSSRETFSNQLPLLKAVSDHTWRLAEENHKGGVRESLQTMEGRQAAENIKERNVATPLNLHKQLTDNKRRYLNKQST